MYDRWLPLDSSCFGQIFKIRTLIHFQKMIFSHWRPRFLPQFLIQLAQHFLLRRQLEVSIESRQKKPNLTNLLSSYSFRHSVSHLYVKQRKRTDDERHSDKSQSWVFHVDDLLVQRVDVVVLHFDSTGAGQKRKRVVISGAKENIVDLFARSIFEERPVTIQFNYQRFLPQAFDYRERCS
jgi:hypothetical protein